MAFGHACHVRHATEIELDIEFVVNLVKPVVWGIETGDVSFS